MFELFLIAEEKLEEMLMWEQEIGARKCVLLVVRTKWGREKNGDTNIKSVINSEAYLEFLSKKSRG